MYARNLCTCQFRTPRIMYTVNKRTFLMEPLMPDSHNISVWRLGAKTTNPIISPTLGRLNVNVIYKRKLIPLRPTTHESEY